LVIAGLLAKDSRLYLRPTKFLNELLQGQVGDTHKRRMHRERMQGCSQPHQDARWPYGGLRQDCGAFVAIPSRGLSKDFSPYFWLGVMLVEDVGNGHARLTRDPPHEIDVSRKLPVPVTR